MKKLSSPVRWRWKLNRVKKETLQIFQRTYRKSWKGCNSKSFKEFEYDTFRNSAVSLYFFINIIKLCSIKVEPWPTLKLQKFTLQFFNVFKMRVYCLHKRVIHAFICSGITMTLYLPTSFGPALQPGFKSAQRQGTTLLLIWQLTLVTCQFHDWS